ncbi:hypothetical protein SAMN05421869_117122 [Nonomuraea jiangxiensis]|uniref:Uncharacterized protein n=1 Tax=Nonomuraea jiangxiensis TaxID=633440 RepID=A0A1G9DFF2_9ACTN|nr:hypothetical protein SAMN05421869_117122 [Nonomuraea jiangxiensis]
MNVRDSGPECGSIAEWNRSCPPRLARHWKNITESAARDTACNEPSRIRPGSLTTLSRHWLTALAACSISSHGCPPLSERNRSNWKAADTCEPGSAGSG